MLAVYRSKLGRLKGWPETPALQESEEATCPETKRDYKIGYGKPPRGRPFQKGQSSNPRGARGKNLSALLIAALNEPA
jgi:hypothetical protein